MSNLIFYIGTFREVFCHKMKTGLLARGRDPDIPFKHKDMLREAGREASYFFDLLSAI